MLGVDFTSLAIFGRHQRNARERLPGRQIVRPAQHIGAVDKRGEAQLGDLHPTGPRLTLPLVLRGRDLLYLHDEVPEPVARVRREVHDRLHPIVGVYLDRDRPHRQRLAGGLAPFFILEPFPVRVPIRRLHLPDRHAQRLLVHRPDRDLRRTARIRDDQRSVGTDELPLCRADVEARGRGFAEGLAVHILQAAGQRDGVGGVGAGFAVHPQAVAAHADVHAGDGGGDGDGRRVKGRRIELVAQGDRKPVPGTAAVPAAPALGDRQRPVGADPPTERLGRGPRPFGRGHAGGDGEGRGRRQRQRLGRDHRHDAIGEVAARLQLGDRRDLRGGREPQRRMRAARRHRQGRQNRRGVDLLVERHPHRRLRRHALRTDPRAARTRSEQRRRGRPEGPAHRLSERAPGHAAGASRDVNHERRGHRKPRGGLEDQRLCPQPAPLAGHRRRHRNGPRRTAGYQLLCRFILRSHRDHRL